jgi:hypothetical protein
MAAKHHNDSESPKPVDGKQARPWDVLRRRCCEIGCLLHVIIKSKWSIGVTGHLLLVLHAIDPTQQHGPAVVREDERR